MSIFSNEKLCTFAKTSCRRFFANPAEARAQVKPPSEPQPSEIQASSTSTRPVFKTVSISVPALIWFTRFAVMNGIKTSITTSKTIRMKVMIVGFLNSRTLFMSCFIIGL